MNADLERLIALQQQDLEGKRLRAELIEAPKWVAAAEAALKKAQTALATAEDALKKEEVLRRRQELDAEERRGKIKRLSKQMETATSTAQITALEHEIKFAEECSRCHVLGPSSTPDLRRLNAGLHAAFKDIVLKGVLAPAGMERFDDILSDTDADNIHAYLIDESWKAYKAQEAGH